MRLYVLQTLQTDWIPADLRLNRYRGLFPTGYEGRALNLTAHFHLVLGIRLNVVITVLPHMPSWLAQELI